MRDHLLLTLGVGTVGATLGYMVGGSATPVVSVAVPAIFGLVVTAVGLMQAAQPSKALLELLKTLGDKADKLPEIADFRARQRTAPARIGITLIAFSLMYLAGATVGASVRASNVLAPTQTAPAFPWSLSDVKPPTISAALQWLTLQGRLRELGYDETRIRELYEIQISEWKKGASSTAPAGADPAKPPTSRGPQSPVTEDLIRRWFIPGTGPIVAPFAYQPDLIDKLKGAVRPDGTKPGEAKG